MTRLMITGGIKSGKSSYALVRAGELPDKKTFLATAVAFDAEMEKRIIRHKAERGPDYITIEETVDIHKHNNDNLVLDCVTVWVNNLFYNHREDEMKKILKHFLTDSKRNLIIVTNEVGLGNIPLSPEARRYNEYLAAANKIIAQAMDEVVLMVSGLPLWLKGAAN